MASLHRNESLYSQALGVVHATDRYVRRRVALSKGYRQMITIDYTPYENDTGKLIKYADQVVEEAKKKNIRFHSLFVNRVRTLLSDDLFVENADESLLGPQSELFTAFWKYASILKESTDPNECSDALLRLMIYTKNKKLNNAFQEYDTFMNNVFGNARTRMDERIRKVNESTLKDLERFQNGVRGSAGKIATFDAWTGVDSQPLMERRNAGDEFFIRDNPSFQRAKNLFEPAL